MSTTAAARSASHQVAAAAGPRSVTVVVGNPRPQSRTLTVAQRAATMLCADLRRHGTAVTPPRLVDLALIAPELAAWNQYGTAATAALDAVRTAGLVLVASPTFKASYSGLLKLFLDILPPGGLTGVTAAAMMTAASPGHRGAVDAHLLPLLIELGAAVPAPGLSVLEADLGAPDAVIGAWLSTATPILASVLSA